MKRKITNKKSENTFVHIVMHGDDNKKYECAGALIKKGPESLRIAFSSKNNVVVDYIDIKKENIIKIDVVNPLIFDC